MTQLDEAVAMRTRSTVPGDLAVVVATVVAALAGWLAWAQAGGVDLTVRSAGDVHGVGAGSAAVTAVVVSGAAVALLRLFEARLQRALRTWTVVACGVLALSMLGPLGATTATAGLGLASLHLLVGAVVVLGLRRVHRAE